MVWATVQRRPLLTAEVWPRLKGAFRSIGHRIGVDVMEVGGVDDHVHVLVRVPTTLSVATVAKHLKGASSHLINHSGGSPRLRWQGGYGAFTVSVRNVPAVRRYIRDQPARHRTSHLNPALERTDPPPQSAEPTSPRS